MADDRISNSLDISEILLGIQKLSSQDRAKVLQQVLDSEDPTNGLAEQYAKDNITAHACQSCEKLVINNRKRKRRNVLWEVWNPGNRNSDIPMDRNVVEDETEEEMENSYSGGIVLSKDAFVQGLTRDCMLMRWVLAILTRGLVKVKSDMEESRIPQGTPSHLRIKRGSSAEDVQYLSDQAGISVMITEEYATPGAAILSVMYELEPALADQLWDASQNLSRESNTRTKNYKTFVAGYEKSMTTPLRVYTDPRDPAASELPHDLKHGPRDPDQYFRKARDWLGVCRDTHEKCGQEPGRLPCRVLDIGTRWPARYVRLHWPEEGEVGDYAVLSYCWGGPQSLATTKQNAQEFTDGILFSKFPQTLQDAIVTTAEMGLRYIWIDCLCIIQDDPEDVAREISRMAEIFSRATVTISAASARAVQEGFLRSEVFVHDTPLRLPFKKHDGTMGSIYMEQPRSYTPEEDPISLRAWTLQEHFLSRRILMFSTRDLWWTCKESLAQNDPLRVEAAPPSRLDSSSQNTLSHWRTIVEDYTRRFLTYPNDKLPALAGIAADYSERLGDTYLAGLWQHAILSELLWSSKRSDISRPMVERAPSWSWAAVDGEISHDWCPLDPQGALDILYVQVTPVSTSSPFGSVDPTRSELRVEGELAKVYWDFNRKYISVKSTNVAEITFHIDVGRTQADADDSGSIPKEPDAETVAVWLLVVSRHPTRGLILAETQDQKYRRVGICFRLWDEFRCLFERKVVSII